MKSMIHNESDLSLTDALFECSNEGIIITDKEGIIIKINPSAEKLFGYSHDNLLGKKIEVLVPQRVVKHHDLYRNDFIAHPEARSMGNGRDLYALRADNTEFPVEISLSYFKMNNQPYVISFIIDITTRKNAENEILKAKSDLESYAEQLKISNLELEQFAYVASHDLQEPLRKIQAFGDRIRTAESEKLSENGKDYLDRILNAAVRMQNLINALLTFSRISSQAKPVRQINLKDIINEVLSDLEINIENTKAAIEITGDFPVIEADPTQMWQLFQNLLSNGLKFHIEGKKPIIKIIGSEIFNQNEKCLSITISDNGIGFDEKYADKIFNIFQRLEGNNYKGTGVGLAICRKIVQRHNGEIIANSKLGVGSDFMIILPFVQPFNIEKQS